ncbi:MAG TPA: xanthine dehydrogenase family protein subunit M [Candidatus Polarisedimenticolia bacterium]|nr:xanthine dehydrogenase family protein subunit M [Candidatus Polarisedimenticolia bacterium]
MRPFAYVEPDSIEGASRLLAKEGVRAKLIAGGVDLLGEMKDRLVEPETLVNLKSVPGLAAIRFDADGTLRLGALATLASVAAHDRLRHEFRAIAQAALSVGSPEIRNVGTVGGNLCQRPRCWYYRSPLHKCLKKGGDVCFTTTGESRYHAVLGGGPSFIVHPSDLAPALIACEARVTVVGPGGKKDLPLEQFYVLPSVRLDHETILQPGEIVTEVAVPPTRARNAFLKFKEKDSFDFALVSVAALVRLEGDTCASARLVLGGVAPIPWRAKEAEKALAGKVIDAAVAARAADAALAEALPMEHNGYKIPLAKALVRRVLLHDLAPGAPDLGPA